MRKFLLIFVTLWLCRLTVFGQPLCNVVRYDEEDGVPSSHITQLLQDEQGFMWFATWNGLCRFDGYDFRSFKTQVGDGCHMTTDRIRNITLLPNGNILCYVDDDYFMFDKTSYHFRDLTAEELRQAKGNERRYLQSRSLQRKPFVWQDSHHTEWTLKGDGHLSYLDPKSGHQEDYPLPVEFRTLTFAMTDKMGNLWALDYGSIYKFTTDVQRTQRVPIEPHAEVKCLFSDAQRRYWVTTKDDEAVRIYNGSDDRLIGYLDAGGHIRPEYCRFGAAVYCMCQTKDGTLWLGAKPQGLYRLRPAGENAFKIDHFSDIPNTNIYHLVEDRQGHLWVATLGGGVFCTSQPQEELPRFSVPRHYPTEAGQRARYLLTTNDDMLLIATSSGVLVSQVKPMADDMHFRLHQREPDRKGSLSCSATMDVVQDRQGRFFVSTESGGINLIENASLQDSLLSFQHLKDLFHVQPNDIVLSLTTTEDDGLIAVGSHLITLLDSTLQGRVLDVRNFSSGYRFSEAHPLNLGKGRWLFGLTDGAFVTTYEQMCQQAYQPSVVLTGISVQGTSDNWAIACTDTIVMNPSQRSFTIHFAALDYGAPDRISYSFRLLPNERWNYIGHDRSTTLLDLEPGTYQMEIRSTDADGQWLDNTRTLTIVVTPTFWESAWGRLLILLLIVGVVATVVYTLLYVRRIKRQQHETLEKYLALIDGERFETRSKKVENTTDPILQRIMDFVEENIGNSDANVGDMAEAAAISRSGLQRKLKQAMGITPQDLMREARIKRACQQLRETDKNVSEIAYACGFTDPKYFSRCFKQSTGQSPTEYKNAT